MRFNKKQLAELHRVNNEVIEKAFIVAMKDTNLFDSNKHLFAYVYFVGETDDEIYRFGIIRTHAKVPLTRTVKFFNVTLEQLNQ